MAGDDKTEQPTAKKKKDERKKGNVAKSKEVSNAFTLIAAVMCVFLMIGTTIRQIKVFLTSYLRLDFAADLTDSMAHGILANGLSFFVKIFLPLGLAVMAMGVISHIIQAGVVISKESFKPKFDKLNPMKGIKNMFSQKAFVSALKNTFLLVILSYIGYSFMKENFADILKLGDVYFPNLIYVIFDIVKKLFFMAIGIAVVIGAIDFAYQLYSHKKGMKMTKQEVKDEYKQAEGDPQVKSQIKQKQRQISGQRRIQNTQDADVVIVNPTHISIAIRYKQGIDEAPVVVAKGADILALKIREIAKDNDIPIIENIPLARMIYKEVEVDQQVPAEMYQAVAEVLVAVYKIKNRYKRNN